MSENTKLWDILGRTDPKHTKPFKRAGGFSGTAIKPMWSYRRMTEEFGPCGLGWGVGEPSFQVVPGVNNEVLVYCTASIWYRDAAVPTPEAHEAGVQIIYGERHTVYGVGGDRIVSHIRANDQYNRPERWENDDEAFKKAFTDAVTNALKLIGVGADVHMGMFDDNKYVNTMKQEFADGHQPATPNTVTGPAIKDNDPQFGDRRTPHVKDWHEGEQRREAASQPAKPASSAELKRNGEWDQFLNDLYQCTTVGQINGLYKAIAAPGRKLAWSQTWLEQAIEACAKRKAEVIAKEQVEADADVFPGEPNYISTLQAG